MGRRKGDRASCGVRALGPRREVEMDPRLCRPPRSVQEMPEWPESTSPPKAHLPLGLPEVRERAQHSICRLVPVGPQPL